MHKFKQNRVGIQLTLLILGLCLQSLAYGVLVDWDDINSEKPQTAAKSSNSVLDGIFSEPLTSTLSLASLNTEQRYTVMLSALQTGEINGAIALAEELAPIYKTDIHIAAIKSMAAIQANKFSLAKKQISPLKSEDKFEKSSILLAQALLSIAEYNYDQANQQLTSLITLLPKHGYAYVLIAHVATMNNMTNDAKLAIDEALKYYPNMRIALNSAGQQALTAGNYPLALNYFNRLISNDGKCTAKNGKARALIGLRQFASVPPLLQSCTGTNANTESVLLAIATLNELRQFDQSWKLIQSSFSPENTSELELTAGRIALKRGDYKNALKYSKGNSIDHLFLNSLVQIAENKYAVAEKQLTKILNQNDKSDLVRISIATAQLLQNKKDQTVLNSISKDSIFYPFSALLQSFNPEATASNAVDLFYKSKGISANLSFDSVAKTSIHNLLIKADKEALILGVFFTIMDSPTIAAKYLQKGANNQADFLSAYLLAAQESTEGKFASAESHIRKALANLSSSFTARYLLGDLLMKQNKLKLAVTEFDSALKLKPDAFAALKAGAISERLKDNQSAEKYYRLAIKTLPSNFAVYNQLAWFLSTQNRDLDEALKLASTALELAPGSANIQDTLGWIHYQKGSLDLAKKTLEEARSSSSDHSILYHLAMVEKKLGNSTQSKSLFEEILKSKQETEYSAKAKAELSLLTKS